MRKTFREKLEWKVLLSNFVATLLAVKTENNTSQLACFTLYNVPDNHNSLYNLGLRLTLSWFLIYYYAKEMINPDND